MVSIKQKRLEFLTRLSKKRRWDFGDNNPFFQEVWTFMDKIGEVKSLREYKKLIKLERKKYAKMAMFNYIRTRLCV